MLNPDTPAFERAQEVMANGQMVGDYRPVGRVTIGKNTIKAHRGQPNVGLVRQLLWDQHVRATEREFLGVVKAIDIRRSIDDDASTCSITLYNEGSNINSAPLGNDTMGRPGYWSPNRREKNTFPEPSTYQKIIHMVAHAPGDIHYTTDAEILIRISDMRKNRSLAPDDAQDKAWQQDIINGHTTLAHVRTELDAQAAEALGFPRWPVEWNYSSPERYNNPSNSESGDPTAYPTAYLNELLTPNRIIRTYQGYGSSNVDEFNEQLMPADDGYVTPWEDDYLFQTGVWLIDSVNINQDGLIVIECSDLAKLLIKQFIWPPMLPMNRFPLTYCPVHEASGDKGGTGKNVAQGYARSSNDPWYGHNASVFGHRPSHAFDGNPSTYWLSVGNAGPTRDFSFEWIETTTGGNEVSEIVLNVRGGNYTLYISVMENGVWQGANTVPYNRNAAAAFPNGADIKYVRRTTIGGGGERVIKLPRTYKAQRVRVCFSNLWNSGLGIYPFRAAVREFRARWKRPNTYEPSNRGEEGAIESWTDAVKELLAWGGFTWYADPDKGPTVPPDPLLGRDRSTNVPLRVWGDFEITPAPKECSEPDQFLNKSFMEGINIIREWLGCVFFVDESGGAIFRLPNILRGGNFINDPDAKSYASDTTQGRNAIQTVVLDPYGPPWSWGSSYPSPGGLQGVWRLRFDDQWTANIAWDAGASTIKARLEALSNCDGVSVSGSGTSSSPWRIEFTGPNVRERPQPLLVMDHSSLVHNHTTTTVKQAQAGRRGTRVVKEMAPVYIDREWPIEFHDDANLIDYALSFDDSELRSEILVVGGTPNLTSEVIADSPILGGVLLQSGIPGIKGGPTTSIDFSRVLQGQYRLMVPPSENTKGFTEEDEAQRMAELTALFILFTYRRGEVSSPAHPGLQLDDQVRVFNRMTNEFNVQYVSAINSTMDLDEGVYTMDCSLHWLGGDPDTEWFFDRFQVTPAMRNYPAFMQRLGSAREQRRELTG